MGVAQVSDGSCLRDHTLWWFLRPGLAPGLLLGPASFRLRAPIQAGATDPTDVAVGARAKTAPIERHQAGPPATPA